MIHQQHLNIGTCFSPRSDRVTIERKYGNIYVAFMLYSFKKEETRTILSSDPEEKKKRAQEIVEARILTQVRSEICQRKACIEYFHLGMEVNIWQVSPLLNEQTFKRSALLHMVHYSTKGSPQNSV